jgi:hypothetical protein
MTKAAFYFSRYSPPPGSFAQDHQDDIESPSVRSILQELIHSSPSLKRLEFYVRQGSCDLQADLGDFEDYVKLNNWNVNTWIEVRATKSSR